MRHHNNKRKFGRNKNQRNALVKSLALSLIKNGRIETSEAKAKEVRPYVEKMVTIARRGGLADKRTVIARFWGDKPEIAKLFADIAPKYKERAGGYTRITKLPQRLSDGSKRAMIEFV